MPNVDIHWLAVIVAAVINMVVGSIWYQKSVFGKQWEKLSGKHMIDANAGAMAYGALAVFSLVQAWILAHFVVYALDDTFMKGLATGFWLWLGFTALTMAANMTFEKGAAWGLLKINAGYWLVVFLINGGLLAAWH